ncbi:DUF3830 family protein [Rhodococcus triatomae]|uniref:DUF3830 family protein n=1 Tax=Rhodococcus triatomae TaxID=300028 RepID=A0A1G8M2F7_9NOCA|nr:DUF3830 family protein [Rhodococcus triatomae]QNG18211.1 DUF3830 family protein [Rhodococcus triatomae]QNG22118.1 DUF3830 family protein [Rhodococcus triatomae]SDI62131.1 Protein of unknown function [Rhodococcus triatomae]
MTRYIDITLTKRGVTCVAELLDDVAPKTCTAVWNALPQGVNAYHAKYARNEIYTLVDAFAEDEPPLENPTITPIPGDIMYFTFAPWQLSPKSHGYGDAGDEAVGKIDLALFYERNNLLLNPDFGFVPGTVFASVVRGLDAMAAASRDMWMRGVEGEVLRYSRHEGPL